MGRLLNFADIEEFRQAQDIPPTTINDTILARVRQLREKEELELFIRDIICDKNETPHNSVEIADILTTKVTVDGRPLLAAFVNKGASYEKVTAKNTAHQISRLQDIPSLGLIVLTAVGNIYDDIMREVTRAAANVDAHWMILGAPDIARLFIAYDKICRRDGTPLAEGRCVQCGYEAPYAFEYDILELRENSHANHKRYAAEISTRREYSRDAIRQIIRQAIVELRASEVYRSELTKARYGNQPTDVVTLFLCFDEFDRQMSSWYCKARWINPTMSDNERRALLWNGELYEDVIIVWTNDYEARRKRFRQQRGSKEDWVEKLEELVPRMDELILRAASLFNQHLDVSISDDDVVSEMTQLEPQAHNVSALASQGNIPPIECKDADQTFQELAAYCHNAFLPFATWGKQVPRTLQQQLWLVRSAIQDYEKKRQAFQYEWEKVRR